MIKLILFSYRSVNSIHPYLPVPRIPYSTACTRHNMRDLYAPSCRLCKRQKLAHMMSWYTHACLLPCIILLFFFFIIAITFLFLFLTYEHAESVFRLLVFNVFDLFSFFANFTSLLFSFVRFLSSSSPASLRIYLYRRTIIRKLYYKRLFNVFDRISFTVSIW